MATDSEREPAATLRRCRAAACDIAAAESKADLFERTAAATAELFGVADVRLCAVDAERESVAIERVAGTDVDAEGGDGAAVGSDGGRVAPAAAVSAAAREALATDEVVVDDGETTGFVVPVDDTRVLCFRRSDRPERPDATSVDGDDAALAGLIGQAFATTLDRLDHAAALDERESALARKNERLDRFAGLVAHEFRNPIGIASGHLDLVVGTESDERHLEAARGAVDRMDRLTESLLDLVRGEPLSGNVDAVDLGYLAKGVFDAVCPAAATLTIEDRTTVRANGRRLRTALESLFDDAVARGGSSVEIRIGTLDEGGFYVADDGPGLERDVGVDPFGYRPVNETDRRDLRLAIVYDVATAHGWQVALADCSDGGVRIEFETAHESSR
ncbi:sensor histidine kinase [Halobellus sp. Atlit-38R]|jgi:signal transduction histidine kinase|uniref:sensor histidine kinase n=2 Tax=Haloferacaceae TaxID=1644056 RepID=UPI000EF1A726|nr:HAMP domain-containing sensor histidine kinase [Halobellus sp. Atlit-38R]RLM88873.1 sensor histidine kinase [Halobellus sp. Atlit-38R]